VKKTIAIFSFVALALGVYGADARTLITRNSGDDFGIFTNVKNEMKLEIEVDNKTISTTKVYTNASTGGNGIFAKDDITNASIESDDATNDTTVTEVTGSTLVDYDGLGCGCDDEADVEVSDNLSDDGHIVAFEDNEVEEEVEVDSFTLTNTNLVATSEAGDQHMFAGEDVDTASIKTGKATTSFVADLLKGSVIVRRLAPSP